MLGRQKLKLRPSWAFGFNYLGQVFYISCTIFLFECEYGWLDGIKPIIRGVSLGHILAPSSAALSP